jgi:putative two-component system response regulator
MTPSSSANPQPRLLVAHSEPTLRALFREWIEADHLRCTEAEPTPSVLEQSSGGPFSLILFEARPEDAAPGGLISRLRQRSPSTALLAVSDQDDQAIARTAIDQGAWGWMVMPFSQNRLRIDVACLLRRREEKLAALEFEERLEREVASRVQGLRQREEEIALRLVWASEYRDNQTGAHIRRIGLFSAALAETLGWEPASVDDVRIAATMHDVGKIGVPDTILRKPGRLSTEEFEIIKRHVEIGADILGGSDLPLLRMAHDIALAHHERWDGRGYPNGLQGEEIPEAARIVAVADVFDALLHERPYKSALSEAEALRIMTEERGKHFDPRIFDAFLLSLPALRRIIADVARQSPRDRNIASFLSTGEAAPVPAPSLPLVPAGAPAS